MSLATANSGLSQNSVFSDVVSYLTSWPQAIFSSASLFAYFIVTMRPFVSHNFLTNSKIQSVTHCTIVS